MSPHTSQKVALRYHTSDFLVKPRYKVLIDYCLSSVTTLCRSIFYLDTKTPLAYIPLSGKGGSSAVG
jgi:hypothetical protein